MKKIMHLLILLMLPIIIHGRAVFKGEGIWPLTRQLKQASCDVTITQSMISAGNFTIERPGVYCLAESIVGIITIASNNVVLDLNQKQLTGSVLVTIGLSFVTITNGTIHAGTGQGIVINSGCRLIAVKDCIIVDCIQDGIFIDQSIDTYVTGCTLVANSTGLTINNSSRVIVSSCQAENNTAAGFSLLATTTSTILECKAINNGIGGTGNIFGFVSQNGMGNVFEQCIANGTTSLTSNSTNNIVAGFALLGDEQCTKIINSESGNTGFGGTPYGILVQNNFSVTTTTNGVNLVETASVNSSDNATSVSWAPNGCFVANAHTSGLSVYKVPNSSTLQLVTTVAVAYLHVDWSADGNFLVATDGTNIDFYRFDYLSLNLIFLSRFTPGQSITTNVRWAHNSFNFIYGILSGSVTSMASGLFNITTNTATLISSQPFNGIPTLPINYVDWAPTDDFIVGVGSIDNTTTPQNNVLIYPIVNGTIGAVVAQSVYGFNSTAITGQTARAVSWSPLALQDTLAVCGPPVEFGSAPGIADICLYQFDRSALTLTPGGKFFHDGFSNPGFFSVDWSLDGQYVVAGGSLGTANPPFGQVMIFTQSSPILTVFALATWQAAEIVNSVKFSTSNALLAVDGGLGSVVGGKTLSLFTSGITAFLSVASNNSILHNLVYCTSSLNCNLAGVGISANGANNFVAGNTSVNNDANYQFVIGVYNGGLNGSPTLLQNISIPPK